MFSDAEISLLAFCFIHLRIRIKKEIHSNVYWQDFAIWFVPLDIEASEEHFEKFNE